MKLLIGGRKRNVQVGPKGGKYYMKGGMKVYLRKMNGGGANPVNTFTIPNKYATSLLLVPGSNGIYNDFGNRLYEIIHTTTQETIKNNKTGIFKNGQHVLGELDIELLRIDNPDYSKVFTDDEFKKEYSLFLAERNKKKKNVNNINNNVSELDWSANYLKGKPVRYKSCVDEGEGPQKSLRTYRYQSLKYYLKSKSNSINHLVLLGNSEGGAFLLLLLQDIGFCELFRDRFTVFLISPAFTTQVILKKNDKQANISITAILKNVEKYGIKLCLINTDSQFDKERKNPRKQLENSLIEGNTMITLAGSNHSISKESDVDIVWNFVYQNQYVIPGNTPLLKLTKKDRQ